MPLDTMAKFKRLVVNDPTADWYVYAGGHGYFTF